MDFIPPTEKELQEVETLKQLIQEISQKSQTNKTETETETETETVQEATKNEEEITSELIDELTNVTYLRFYRGRKHIMNDAKQSLINHLKWRKGNNVGNYESFDIKNEVESKKSFIQGTDKKGHPVVYVFARRHDKYNRDVDEITRFIIHTISTALKQSVPTEEQIIIVFDLTNFGLSCMDYEAVKILISILAHNYPEILATVHIVNHPWLFNACWAVIRPWIDPVTAEKVNFTSVADLPKFIEPENIPEDLGNYDN